MPDVSDARSPVRVGLSNDYEVVLRGLAAMLADYDQIEVVDLAIEATQHVEADLVLFDTFGRLPHEDPKLRRLVAENARRPVAVYSWTTYPPEEARRAGAAGYIHKGVSADVLVAAIVRIHQGAGVTTPSFSAEAEEAGMPTWPGKEYGLSARESEVITWITRGLSNDEVSRRSYLSINTVKTYIRTAYRKMGVNRRSQAVIWGYEHGFGSTEDDL